VPEPAALGRWLLLFVFFLIGTVRIFFLINARHVVLFVLIILIVIVVVVFLFVCLLLIVTVRIRFVTGFVPVGRITVAVVQRIERLFHQI